MAVTLTVNSVGYSFPSTGDQPPWGDGITNWASAVTTGMLQKAGGAFALTADVNFGASFGLVSTYFTSRTANAASAGAVRLAKTDVINFRNNANGGNLSLGINGTDQLTFNSSLLLTTTGSISASKALVSDGSGSIISHASTTATQIGYLATAGSNIHGDTDAATLTNKTLTAPIISTISNTGTLTLPTATDTLVGQATTDTLTNKTIAAGSNTISGLSGTQFATQSANTVLAGPTSGSAATPTFRALSPVDMPSTRNFLINSNFDFWQRGTSITATTGAPTYGPDRWYCKNASGANVTVAQVAGTSAGALYGCKLTFGAATSNNMELYQVLENADAIRAYNQTISFTCQIKAVQRITQVGITLCYETTEIKLAGVNVIAAESTFTVNNSSFVTCTISGVNVSTLPSTAGVIGVKIRCTAQSGGTNIYESGNGFTVEQAMLNIGSTAAPYARKGASTQEELAVCQRYCEQAGAGAVGTWVSSTTPVIGIQYKVTKRATPTISFTSSSVTVNEVGVADHSNTPSSTSSNTGVNGCLAQFALTGAGATAGKIAIVKSDYVILADAEI